MPRHEFSLKIKTAAALRANGHCENCTRPLATGDFHYDHDRPDGLLGEATLANCRVLCKSCHALKTKTDVKRIAKAKRVYRKSHGIRKQSRFPGSRNSRWKKKLNGQVVARD